MLLDPTHKVLRVFVGRCNLCNPVIKERPFCRSCSRAKQIPILSSSCMRIVVEASKVRHSISNVRSGHGSQVLQ